MLYFNADKKNPPKPALKNINTAFLNSFIQTKNPANKIIINNNNLSLKTSDIILAICAKAFISSKSAIILSKSLFGNFIATTANAMKTNIFTYVSTLNFFILIFTSYFIQNLIIKIIYVVYHTFFIFINLHRMFIIF